LNTSVLIEDEGPYSVIGIIDNFDSSEILDSLKKGIWLIPNKLQIRDIRENDLSIISFWTDFDKSLSGVESERSVILELRNLEIDDILKSEYGPIEKGLLAFRLLKLGNIHLKMIMAIPPNPLSLGSLKFTSQLIRPTSKYKIDLNDIDKLKNIFKQLYQVELDKYPSIRIACDRFNRSYADVYLEDKLIDLCIAIEALFLRGEKQHSDLGMGQVVGLACSMLIGNNITERTDIQKNIVSSFSLRNKVVHGQEIDPNRRKRIEEILPDFENYLRRSILRLIS